MVPYPRSEDSAATSKAAETASQSSWLDKPKYTNVKSSTSPHIIPKGSWVKCPACLSQLMGSALVNNHFICDQCRYYFRMPWDKRIELLSDARSFKALFTNIISSDPLNFKAGSITYKSKLNDLPKRLGINEAVITGTAKLNDIPIALAVMEFDFIGGSMGSAMGERLYQLMKLAAKKKLPFISCASSGGARMQEGILSLMQMAKTSAGIELLAQAKAPFISILTNPTMGGVTASFASLGDIIISEPNAMIGFAGRRVIEQTVRQELPPTFQTAEFLKKHGFVDMIVKRTNLKTTLARLLRLLLLNS